MLIVFDFLQVSVQASIQYSALSATSNILCLCLKPSFEHRSVGFPHQCGEYLVQSPFTDGVVGLGNEYGSL